MKTSDRSLLLSILASGVAFVGLLSTGSAQTLQQAPLNPAFLQYQQERGQKAAAPGIVSKYGRGLIPTPIDFSYLKGRVPAGARTLQALPASYDLRTLGKLTPIRNQNPYGTCWAFASFGSLESCLLTAETNDFSENNLANLHGFDYGYDDGGTHLMSMAYLARWAGPVNEADDPYPNPGHSPSNLTVRKHVQEVLVLPLKTAALDNSAIKQAVVDYGAMYISMYYADDAYNSANSAYYYTNNILTNGTGHAVAIVGWNDDYPAENFSPAAPGNGAFIVRNSWGANWGDGGYFYCSYYDTKMGYQANASFNNAESVTNYASIYQYDPLGWVNSYGYDSTNAWAANIFTATNNETLRAIGFYTTDLGVYYEISIYKNITAGNPTSGTLTLAQTGTRTYAGYHTIALASAVEVASGQSFSVVIKFVNSSYTFPIAYEYAQANYSSHATSSPGESYVSSDGATWTDLTTYDSTANVCIKAFCGTGSATATRADPAVVDSAGNWYVWFSGSAYQRGGPWSLGVAGMPVAGDFDGDRYTDPAIVDQTTGDWRVWFTSQGYQMAGPWNLGIGTPAPADFDGDRYADPAVVDSAGNWYVWFTSLSYQMGGPYALGVAGIPVPADFDGQ